MGEVLHRLRSVCSACRADVRAELVRKDDGSLWLKKRCFEHGEEWVLESTRDAFYHVAPVKACGDEPGCCEPAGATCVALVEVTDACNLECPLCYASSGPSGKFTMSLAELRDRIDAVLQKRGVIDILMLSGGEPTVHPEFEALLATADAVSKIKRILLNTNGLALSRSQKLREAVLRSRGKLELYLQLDSLLPQTTEALRGRGDLVGAKLRLLDWLEAVNLPTTFAVTLRKGTPPGEIGDLVRFGLEKRNVRGCTFQPAFASGRHPAPYDPKDRLTTADAVALVCEAAPELFTEPAFVNLPCSHPNCAIVAYYYRESGRLWPLSAGAVPDETLKNRIDFTLEDLQKCGCETTDLGRTIASTEVSSENTFRVVVKPFMDRFTLNRDRTSQCCTHVVGPGGELMSFCEYNVFRDRLGWDRNQ